MLDPVHQKHTSKQMVLRVTRSSAEQFQAYHNLLLIVKVIDLCPIRTRNIFEGASNSALTRLK
jgi:hypothetical protein